ncbi:MAG: hypothetical protein JNK64_21785 [Myxococcales bacterium]|nr:hypothetical protein [Myxococcales bacterium]
MPRSSCLALVSCALGACTIVYNSDNLPPPTDAADAREVDAQPIDANPDELTLTSVEPAALAEGVGAGGGRPALVVLHGTSLVGGASVAAAFTTGADLVEVAGFDATPDGTEAGVALRIPVLTDLAAGAQRTLRLTVTQGQTSQSIDLMVQGLDELRLTGPTTAAPAGPTRYSRIEVVGNVHVTGTTPLRLEATADIHLTAKLDGNALGATPGPGGCTGGAAEGAGNCTPGGGGAGVNGATLGLGTGGGGGGGGFGAAGTAGTGMGAGGVGMATGNDMLVPLVGGATPDESNRGNGGGGGGGALAAMGGAGAGGGGVIALTAGGDVLVEGNGRVEATGGTANGGSGGGGGGSGGAILIRAGGALTAPGVWLAAAGGGASTGASNAGGPGGVGRIRVDTASGGLAGMATTPVAVRGPAWPVATPVVAASLPSVTLTGEPGRTFQLRLNDTAAPSATPGIDGTTTITGLPWRRGKNQLCAVARNDRLVAESLACVDVYLTAP